MSWFSKLRPFLITAALLTAATYLQLLIWPYIQPAPYILYFPATLLSILYGVTPFAVIGSVLAGTYFFIEPRFTFGAPEPSHHFPSVVFALSMFLTQFIGRKGKRQLEAIQKSKKLSEDRKSQLEAVFESANDGISVVNSQGQMILTNSALARTAGFNSSAEMLQNMEFFNEIFELREMDGKLVPLSEWPVSRVLRGETLQNIPLKGRRLDSGREWYFEFSGQPIFDEHGAQTLAVIITRDRTVAHQLEETVRLNEVRFQAYAEEMPQIAFISDSAGNIFYFNHRFYEYVGIQQNLAGWDWTQHPIIHPDDMDRTMETWKSSLKSGHLFEIEYRVRRYDGEYRWHLARATPIRKADGNIERWLGTVTDIQEQYAVRELLRESRDAARAASEAKSQFLATMSHELRTPLTAVLGFAEILRDPRLREEDRTSSLERIDRSGRALLRLIDDLLDISKIEAGKISLHKVRFSPAQVLSEVLSIFKIQADEKGLIINTHIEDSTPDKAISDPARIRQILSNLIGNAIKFTQKGSIHISMRGLSQGVSKEEFLEIDLNDTGIGISIDDREKLFQHFAQADQSISRRYGGTGLGLVLSRRLSQELGGELWLVKSEIGQGSLFRVRISAGPFEKYTADETTQILPDSSSSKSHPDALSGIQVLLVEDVPDNQMILKNYLTIAKARVEIAENGLEGIEKAQSGSHDLILMDIELPLLDGIEATKRLRALGYSKPILALSAHAMPEAVQRSTEAGCNEHMTKPLKQHELIEAVIRWTGPSEF
jgi:PAS domain S-box-containing protein